MTNPAKGAPSTVPGVGIRVPAFDGVRGVAILAVIVFHTVSLWGTPGPVDEAVSYVRSFGWLGVDLFFVLSGFLITGILLDTKEGPNFFRNFYSRRALRILPLFYGVVLAAAVIGPLLYWLSPFDISSVDRYAHDLWSRQLWLWTYANNFLQATNSHLLPGLGHLWSLAIEEQFYLVWPLVVFALPKRRVLPAAVIGALAIIVLRIALAQSGTDPWAIRQWTFTRADGLLLGGAAAAVVRRPALWASLRRFAPLTAGGGLLFIAVAGIAVGGIPRETAFIVSVIYPVAALTFAAIMLTLCEPGPHRLLEAKWLRTFGFYSYAMYMFHWPIDQALLSMWRRLGVTNALTSDVTTIPMSMLQLASVTALTLVAAMISWRLWEERWLRLKRRFSYHATSSSASA